MSGKPQIIRPTRLETSIPEDLRAKMDLILYSEVENRVPRGAYQRFICERIREFFATQASITARERIIIRYAVDILMEFAGENGYNTPIEVTPAELDNLRKKLS